MHKQKQSGDIGLTHIIADMTEKGWNVGVLLTEHAKYDLLAEKDGKAIRVQVKTKSISIAYESKILEVRLQNSWADKKGNHITVRKKNDYDLLAIWCLDTKTAYYVSDDQLGNARSMFTLMLNENSRKQKNIHLASNFTNITFGPVGNG